MTITFFRDVDAIIDTCESILLEEVRAQRLTEARCLAQAGRDYDLRTLPARASRQDVTLEVEVALPGNGKRRFQARQPTSASFRRAYTQALERTGAARRDPLPGLLPRSKSDANALLQAMASGALQERGISVHARCQSALRELVTSRAHVVSGEFQLWLRLNYQRLFRDPPGQSTRALPTPRCIAFARIIYTDELRVPPSRLHGEVRTEADWHVTAERRLELPHLPDESSCLALIEEIRTCADAVR